MFSVQALPLVVDQELEQVEEYQYIDSQQAGANPGESAQDFNDLPGKKRGGDRQGEVLSPGFFEVESEAFSHGQAAIAKRRQADAAQQRIVEQGCFFKDEIDEARLGVEAKMFGEVEDPIDDVLMDKAASADADGEEQ